MAYDWVYPPRQGGEALIHLNWGKYHTLTKIYHGFRQWCLPLVPGMKVIQTKLKGPAATGISQPGLKASAFISEDGKRIVIHAAAVSEKAIPIRLILDGGGSFRVQRYRTSSTEDMVQLPVIEWQDASAETLPAGSMMTWVFSKQDRNPDQ